MAVQAALGVQVEAAVGRRHAQGPLADARLRGRVVERAEAQLLEPRRQLSARKGGERERLGADLPAPGRQVRLHEPRAMVKGLLAHRLHRGGQAHRGKRRLRERHAAQTTHALRQRHLLEVVQRVERPLVHVRAPGGHLVGAAGNHQAVQVPPVPRQQRPAVGGEGLVGGIDGHALQVRQPEGLRVERLDERPERHVGHRRVRERVSLQPHQGHGELHLRERPALQEHGGVDLVQRRRQPHAAQVDAAVEHVVARELHRVGHRDAPQLGVAAEQVRGQRGHAGAVHLGRDVHLLRRALVGHEARRAVLAQAVAVLAAAQLLATARALGVGQEVSFRDQLLGRRAADGGTLEIPPLGRRAPNAVVERPRIVPHVGSLCIEPPRLPAVEALGRGMRGDAPVSRAFLKMIFLRNLLHLLIL